MADQVASHAEESDGTTMSDGNQTAPDTLETQDQFSKPSEDCTTENKVNDTVEEKSENDDGSSTETSSTSACKSTEERVLKVDKLDELSENGVEPSTKEPPEVGGNSEKEAAVDSLSEVKEHHSYELIDGQYYYSDTTSGKRYRYEEKTKEWVEVVADSEGKVLTEGSNPEHTSEHGITVDSEGRTYYYADNHYMCKDGEGNVFYMNEQNEWKPWAEKECNQSSESSKWYFYQDDSTFYRDNASGVVYKYNKEDNKWEKYEGKLKKKRPHVDDEEEFDTEEEESDGETESGLMPPGAKEDPNINYDGTTYTKVDPSDNMMYEWDAQRRAWFPKLDEDFMATYQLSYGFNPDGTKNENPLKFDDENEEEEEAKAEELKQKMEQENAKATKKKPTWFEMDETRNTKVYVSNLPDSMTEAMFMTLMQKCGMVLLDEKSSKPKVKLYKDEEGNFKGDALCTYIKVESVELALQILDGYQVGNKRISVEPAKFQQKGSYNPKLKPRKKGKKELERLQKKQEKLFDWRPEPLRGQRKKNENTVVIRNVFDPKEFEVAMDKILDHKEAMRSQASNFGKIKKLELYDLHPEGVVQVTFEEVESADMCVATLNKRLYGGRTLYVTTWDGKEKFKIEETAAEREERIKKWNEFLESEATSSNSTK